MIHDTNPVEAEHQAVTPPQVTIQIPAHPPHIIANHRYYVITNPEPPTDVITNPRIIIIKPPTASASATAT